MLGLLRGHFYDEELSDDFFNDTPNSLYANLILIS